VDASPLPFVGEAPEDELPLAPLLPGLLPAVLPPLELPPPEFPPPELPPPAFPLPELAPPELPDDEGLGDPPLEGAPPLGVVDPELEPVELVFPGNGEPEPSVMSPLDDPLWGVDAPLDIVVGLFEEHPALPASRPNPTKPSETSRVVSRWKRGREKTRFELIPMSKSPTASGLPPSGVTVARVFGSDGSAGPASMNFYCATTTSCLRRGPRRRTPSRS
jgi:hypothetical protein